MSWLNEWLLKLADTLYTLKTKNLDWRRDNQAQRIELDHARLLAERQLADELKKQSLRLEHEISLLKTRHAAESAMYKARCRQDIKDYRRYLNSLDQLQAAIQTSYPHLPESVALTIHHHAKHLLHDMWECEDYAQKIRHEMRLIQFMTVVHEDARLRLEGVHANPLPESTLNLIKQN